MLISLLLVALFLTARRCLGKDTLVEKFNSFFAIETHRFEDVLRYSALSNLFLEEF